VGDQTGRQLEQHAGLALAALGLGPAALGRGDQQADHGRDEQVDAERQVVLGVVDDDMVVGPEEQQVEGEEAEPGGGDARPQPTRRRRPGHHQQVGEHHGGLAQLGPEGQQRDGGQDRSADGDDVAERAPGPAHRQPPRDVHATRIGRRAGPSRTLTTSLRPVAVPYRPMLRTTRLAIAAAAHALARAPRSA
jgi:hypothetical protein